MAHLKSKILTMSLVMAVIAGGTMFASTQNINAVKAVHTVEAQSAAIAHVTGEKIDPARKAIQRFDASGKLKNVQYKTRPLGQKIQSSIKIDTVPGANAVTWAERYMSLPAILLILIFGGVFAFMGMAGPTSRLGGHH